MNWLSRILMLVALCLAVGLTACGTTSTGTGSSTGAGTSGGAVAPGDVVASVGGSGITRAEVNHWMATLAGGDYFQLSAGHTVPAGLVSEPPNYSQCVSRLEAAAAGSAKGGPGPTGVQLLTKCRQLYQALRLQAVAVLVRAQWIMEVDREVGVTVNDGEVLRFFKRSNAERFPKESEFQHYLASKRESVSDELLLLKLDLLAQKTQRKMTSGGKPVIAKLVAAEQKWTSKTTCSPGYVVVHCKAYTGEPAVASSPPASVLIEQVAALATGRCTNLAACGKQ